MILSSRANSQELGLPGEQELIGRGVHYCAHCGVRTKPLRQIVTAVSDGAVAVHYAEEYLAGKEGTL